MNEHVIVISDRGYITGGAGSVAINVAIDLSRFVDTYFFCSIGPVCEKLLLSNVKVVCLNQREPLKDKNRIRGFVSNLSNSVAEKELIHLIKSFGDDRIVVHVHGWTKALTSSIFKKLHKFNNVRVIVTLHDYFSVCPNGGLYNYKKNTICKFKGGSIKCLFCNCDKRNYCFKLFRFMRFLKQKRDMKQIKNFIYISDLNKKVFLENNKSNPSLFYLPNFTDFEERFLNNVWENTYFGYVGRFDSEKGIDVFCEATTRAGVKAIAIGDGQLRPSLEVKYPNVKFVGWVEKDKYVDVIKDVKCFIFPSKWYEGAPLVIKEMFSFGIPFLVSDCSSAVEEIVDGKNGYVYGNSIDDLVSFIHKMDSETIKQMNAYIRNNYHSSDYSIDKHVSKLLEIYNTLFELGD